MSNSPLAALTDEEECKNIVFDSYTHTYICADNGVVLGVEMLPPKAVEPMTLPRPSSKTMDMIMDVLRVLYGGTNVNGKAIDAIARLAHARLENLSKVTKKDVEKAVVSAIATVLGGSSGLAAAKALGLSGRDVWSIVREHGVGMSKWDPAYYLDKYFSDVKDEKLKNELKEKAWRLFNSLKDKAWAHGVTWHALLKNIAMMLRDKYLKDVSSYRKAKYRKVLNKIVNLNKIMREI